MESGEKGKYYDYGGINTDDTANRAKFEIAFRAKIAADKFCIDTSKSYNSTFNQKNSNLKKWKVAKYNQ